MHRTFGHAGTSEVRKCLPKEELLTKAQKPAEDALRLHPLYKGKVQVAPKCPIRGFDDFAIWYTPGVAAPCREIQAHPERVFEHTNKGASPSFRTEPGLWDICRASPPRRP